nr:unnamed protein product [Haemonchus contortus]
MTQKCSVLSMAKSIWLRATRQSNDAKSHSAPPVSSIPKTTCNRDAGADVTTTPTTKGIYDKRRSGGGRRILSSLQTILENSSSSTLDSSILKDNPNDELWKDDELDLYRMRSFQNLSLLAPPFYHDSESMDSYGTITSQELLEAFEKGTEDDMSTPLYCPKNNRHASEDGNYTYTDLVYVSTPQKI